MKRVKIMLLSTLVVAAVAGAVAFKAQRTVGLFCGTTTDSCPVEQTINGYTFDNVTPIPDWYCTTDENNTDDCLQVKKES
jgi:hypothetical protein